MKKSIMRKRVFIIERPGSFKISVATSKELEMDKLSLIDVHNERTTNSSCGIYAIINKTTGRTYVGRSLSIRHRWRTHLKELTAGVHHNKYLQADWNKYGKDDFSFQILMTCTFIYLPVAESRFIKEYKRMAGTYNA